jgi:RecT family protein
MPPTPELIPIVSLPTLYNPRDLALIRRTVASDTTDDEFALFIHWARRLRLDPLRRQVHAFVFHKHDPKKRRLSLVTSIEGFRAIVARTRNYRPDENEPAFIADDASITTSRRRRRAKTDRIEGEALLRARYIRARLSSGGSGATFTTLPGLVEKRTGFG